MIFLKSTEITWKDVAVVLCKNSTDSDSNDADGESTRVNILSHHHVLQLAAPITVEGSNLCPWIIFGPFCKSMRLDVPWKALRAVKHSLMGGGHVTDNRFYYKIMIFEKWNGFHLFNWFHSCKSLFKHNGWLKIKQRSVISFLLRSGSVFLSWVWISAPDFLLSFFFCVCASVLRILPQSLINCLYVCFFPLKISVNALSACTSLWIWTGISRRGTNVKCIIAFKTRRMWLEMWKLVFCNLSLTTAASGFSIIPIISSHLRKNPTKKKKNSSSKWSFSFSGSEEVVVNAGLSSRVIQTSDNLHE